MNQENLHFLPRKKLLGKLSLRDFVYACKCVCVYLLFECHYSIQHVPLIGVVVVVVMTATFINRLYRMSMLA